MQCENIFCIYWLDGKCCLDEISLDITGCCEDRIYVSIPEAVLQRERKRNLDDYELVYEAWRQRDKDND